MIQPAYESGRISGAVRISVAVKTSMFLKRNATCLILCSIFLLHALLLLRISEVNAPVFDEIGHLPAGLSHWRTGRFDLYRVNPPLMRMLTSLPLLFLCPKEVLIAVEDGPYDRPEFAVGRNFIYANGRASFRYFTICRWVQIPVSILGAWICFRWSQELSGTASGIAAAILWCFCPNILAWGATLTPDLGASVWGVASAYTFWIWLRAPSWKGAVLAGVMLGLAELSKSTWIILVMLWPIEWLVWRFCTRGTADLASPGVLTASQVVLKLERADTMVSRTASMWVKEAKVMMPPASQLGGILLIAWYLLNLGYGFEGSLSRLDGFNFISHTLGGLEAHNSPGNRFRGGWIGAMPVPVPANYLRGIDVQKYELEMRSWSYLRGEFRLGGWPHYYLYALAVKTPVGTLVMLVAAALSVIASRRRSVPFRDEMVLLLPALAVLALVSSQTGFNHHFRYILPAIPFLLILASRAARFLSGRWSLAKMLTVACLAATAVESLAIFPHSLSFFNRIAGGPLGGPRHLLNSNIDWGQDLLELKRYLLRHPPPSPIRLSYHGFIDPALAGISYDPIQPLDIDGRTATLLPGVYAISVNQLFGHIPGSASHEYYRRFLKLKPRSIIGYSIYIYEINSDLPDAAGRMPTNPQPSVSPTFFSR